MLGMSFINNLFATIQDIHFTKLRTSIWETDDKPPIATLKKLIILPELLIIMESAYSRLKEANLIAVSLSLLRFYTPVLYRQIP